MAKTKEELEEVEVQIPQDRLLYPSEVAAMFGVTSKAVTRWARAGKISCIKTLGGHRRFKESEILRVLAELEEHKTEPDKEKTK